MTTNSDRALESLEQVMREIRSLEPLFNDIHHVSEYQESV